MSSTPRSEEFALTGGANPIQPVLLNNTVRRPLHTRSAYVHALLHQLKVAEVGWAPRFLGFDDSGREILSYIPGEVMHHHVQWSDDQLCTIIRMMRQFHDATAGTTLAEGLEVACHNDIAPWNTVVLDEVPIALIDFNEAAPGRRIDDLAYALWVFLDLGNDTIAKAEQAGRVRLLCDEYGPLDSSGLTEAILQQQQRVLTMRQNQAQNADAPETRQWAQGRVLEIQRAMRWVRNSQI